MGMFRETLFVPEKDTHPQNNLFGLKKMHRVMQNSGSLDYNEPQNVIPKDLEAE